MKNICCICGIKFQGYGNNPEGAVWKNEKSEIEFGEFPADARCCDECNSKYVILGRLYRMTLPKKDNKKEN